MSKVKKKQASPARAAAAVTAVVLGVCGGSNLLLYMLTAYVPLLLSGILQLLPAVLNLFLMIPVGKNGEAQPSTVANEEKENEPHRRPNWFKRMLFAIIRLPGRGCRFVVRTWQNRRDSILATVLVLTVIAFNVYFWLSARGGTQSYVAEAYLPVVMVVLFVLYIVLDKWCKRVGGDAPDQTEERTEDAALTYNRALLHSLRGALAAGRLVYVVMAITLMIRILGLADLSGAVIVAISLLFVYETLLLLFSVGVRVIRREMATAPELSIPMPGLGAEDLGIISYLEKNTGITMRSLWSIRLIKYVIPYAAMSVVLLLWVFSGVVKIEAHQQGAHYRLGRLQEETLQPGLHMTLPWPFDSVEVYNTEIANTMTIGYISGAMEDNIWTQAHGGEEYKLLLGGGNELVSVNLRLVYRIDDLRAYLSNNANPETLLQATSYEVVTAKIIRTDLTSLLSADRTVLAANFKAEIEAHMAAYQTGIFIEDVVLESIHPPVDIADIYQRMVSAEAEALQIVLQAKGMAELIRIDAEGNKYVIVSKAAMEKSSQIKDAEVKAAEFEAFVAAKESWAENGGEHTYEYFRYLQAIAAAYGTGDCQVIMIGDGVNSSNIYIGNISLGGK